MMQKYAETCMFIDDDFWILVIRAHLELLNWQVYFKLIENVSKYKVRLFLIWNYSWIRLMNFGSNIKE